MDDNKLFFLLFGFSSGIAMFFALPFNIAIWFLIGISVFACITGHKKVGTVFLIGFFYAMLRTELIDTELLNRNQSNTAVSGFVERVDYATNKQNVFVRTQDKQLFRISMKERCDIGAKFSGRVKLYAPHGADAFTNFDYRRWSYFNGLSGTGTVIDADCTGGKPKVRDRIHYIVNNKLADALVLGYQNMIPKSEYELTRAGGITHVLSISGFHMALIGAWMFFIFNFITKLAMPFTRRFPSRNLAIPLTVICLFGYLFFSGSGVATVRSFIMISLGFIATLLGRRVFTLRSVAIAFGSILLVDPFLLMTAGFQLSFAAVFGIIYFFTKSAKKHKFFYNFFMTTIVATIWTLPFVAYIFASFPIYGILGNLLLLPIFTFVIMPFVFVGVITSLLGWTAPFMVSDWAYKIVMHIADGLGKLPFAMLDLGSVPPLALFIVFAGMFFFISGYKNRAWILWSICAIYWIGQSQPVLKTTNDNEVVEFNGTFNTKYSENHPFIIPRENFHRSECTGGACEYKTEKWTAISFQRFMPIYKNIERLCDFDFIISYLPIKLPNCQEKVLPGGIIIYKNGTVEHVVTRTY